VGDGVEGEIWIRGLNVAREYHNLPNETARRFAQGWFHTGDFGHRDASGAYFFGGRKDDLIIKGGENIYPAELENVLFAHPAVAECAVIGIPDRVLGEDLCAFVELKSGETATEEDLKAFCAGRIAAFKRPRHVIMLDPASDMPQIPKGPTKKVLYRVLRTYHQERRAER
jgi:acyl-CoA synthetase (AMP-forming)/AMP-acid ligase II